MRKGQARVVSSATDMPASHDELQARGNEGRPDDVRSEALDVGLLEVTLSMTVRERLQLNDRTIRTIAMLRTGFPNLNRSANDRSR
jgi:hypothetical protein